MRHLVCLVALAGMLAAPASALHPGTTVMVPAAARGAGAAGSLWITVVYVVNPGDAAVDVTFAWLVRDQPNPAPLTVTRTVPSGGELVIGDAVSDLFGLAEGGGAILVTAPSPVVVNSAILNRAGGAEFGQGFEGIPVGAAVTAGRSTHAPGVVSGAGFRTNFFAADATGTGSTVTVEVVDTTGAVAGTRTYTLGAHEPILKNVAGMLGGPVADGMLRFTVDAGAVLLGGSRINEGTGDPLTLAAWWDPGAAGGGDGLAPVSLAGMELALVITPVECPIDPFTENVTVEVVSDTQAVVRVYGVELTVPIDGYLAGVDLALVESEVPDWDVTDVAVTMVWNDAAGGRFTGSAIDYDGSPIQFSGTFDLVAR